MLSVSAILHCSSVHRITVATGTAVSWTVHGHCPSIAAALCQQECETRPHDEPNPRECYASLFSSALWYQHYGGMKPCLLSGLGLDHVIMRVQDEEQEL